jgi:hypothetical protein
MNAYLRIIGGIIAVVSLGAAVAALSTTTWAKSQESAMHAEGYFDVTLAPQKIDNPQAQAAALTRLSIDKHYHGDIEGVSQGEMLACGDGKQNGGYVAIEKVTATLNGRSGSFDLLHHAVMIRGVPQDWAVSVVPESGTGQLAGISGTLTITNRDDKHFYALQYTLAER